MFEHESTPAFSDNHEVWILEPQLFAHLNEKWIWISFHVV